MEFFVAYFDCRKKIKLLRYNQINGNECLVELFSLGGAFMTFNFAFDSFRFGGANWLFKRAITFKSHFRFLSRKWLLSSTTLQLVKLEN